MSYPRWARAGSLRCGLPIAAACAAAIGASLLASGGAARQQGSPAPQRPTFRAGVNFVRVDVYPREDGRPVADLRAEDFVVEEDGAAQVISTFEHIVIRDGTAPELRTDPRNVRESNQMAGDPRNRLFVLFLDTFHVTDWVASHNGRSRQPGSTAARLPAEARMGPPTNIDRALSSFLKTSIGPDDLIAAMTPEMDPAELTFIRRPESIEAFLGTTWARRFSSDNLDPLEERYFACYAPDDPQHRFDGVAVEMVARKREAQTIQSLRRLAQRLGELREERKGVVIVSEGWALVRPNQDLARQFKDMAPPQPPGIHVGAGGKLAPGTDPRTFVTADWQQCEADRLRLANLDHRREYLDVLNEANRVNLSFYPIDPRGLAVFDQPLDYQPAAAPRGADEAQVGRVSGVVEDFERLRGRLETLETAASATDGLAMIKSNDLTASLNRVVADLSDYYLIGYASTNSKADGSFRRISVRVKRPGVEVRARRGYRAATAAEVAARAPEWRGGGRAVLTVATPDGQTLFDEEAALSPASPSIVRYLADTSITAGEYVVRVRVQGTESSTAGVTEQVRITVPAPGPAAEAPPGDPVVFRSGPFTGRAFLPTADPRFRRAERLRVDAAVAGPAPAVSARLLDRKGQPLPLPVATSVREESYLRIASAELALAPLGPGDYLIELTVQRGSRSDKVVVAFRIVP